MLVLGVKTLRMLLRIGIFILQKEKARHGNGNGYILVIRQTWKQHAADSLTLTDLSPGSLWLYFAPWCTAWGGSSRNNPGQAKWPSRCSTLSPLSLEKFFLNHQPSCSFSGIGFLSAEHPMCWRMSEHGLLLCRWQILRLTSVGGCRVRCTQPTHCQEVVLAFAHAPGYFTECHHLVMKRSPVTTAHEHRNSLCP